MKAKLLAASLLALSASAFATDVGVSISVGQPGFYGRIDIGDYPAPQLIYRQPVIIERPVHYVESAPIYPASYTDDNILAVASITSAGALASYSNYGSKTVDLAAPGDKIFSTYPSSTYKSLSGTSMASPLVAATAAYLKKRDSSLTYKELRAAIRGPGGRRRGCRRR